MTKEKKVIHILLWVFGVIFLISGLGIFADTPVTGILLLVTSCLAIPPISNKIYSKIPFNASYKSKIAIILVLLFIGGVSLPGESDEAKALRIARENEEKLLSLSGRIDVIGQKPYDKITVKEYDELINLYTQIATIDDSKDYAEMVEIAKVMRDRRAKYEDREKLIAKQFNSWDGSHIGMTALIENSMNDPKSYEHVETRYIDKGDVITVICSFRGKNAFGGIVKNTITADFTLDGKLLKIY